MLDDIGSQAGHIRDGRLEVATLELDEGALKLNIGVAAGIASFGKTALGFVQRLFGFFVIVSIGMDARAVVQQARGEDADLAELLTPLEQGFDFALGKVHIGDPVRDFGCPLDHTGGHVVFEAPIDLVCLLKPTSSARMEGQEQMGIILL